MRTTLTIDDDVLLAAKEIAKRRGVSTGTVLSELARNSLRPNQVWETRDGIPQLRIRPEGKIITLEFVNSLRDEEDW
jgi:hypothetical protein